MSGVDRFVLVSLQALVLLLPLFLGGRETTALAAACALVLVLLVLTVRERQRRTQCPQAPGLVALAAFVVLALLATVPLPPALLEWLSPATARLYELALPGWPEEGPWSRWRPLAISPYDVAVALTKLSVGLGAFAVIVAFPWRTAGRRAEDARDGVVARLVLTVLVGGVLVAALGLLERSTRNGLVMWITEELAAEGRASGPFVNPNHYAAWLEMVLPLALAYGVALVGRLHRRIAARAEAGRGMGVRARRAWVSALVAHQQKLWPSLIAAVGLLLMLIAHAAADSRGGQAALLVGLGVAGVGLALRAGRNARTSRLARWVGVSLPAALVVAAVASMGLWAMAQSDVAEGGMEAAGDMSFGARLAAASLASGIVRDFPLAGTGLGTFLHAFRPYQAPPLESGILDHAHNDYLELATETGLLGVAVAVLFAASVVGGVLRRRRAEKTTSALALRSRRDRDEDRPPGFEVPEWRLALREHHLLRWGLAGGVAAILVHSLVDFGLRLPGNFLLVMVLVALVVLAAGPARPGRAPALVVLLAGFFLAAVPPVANWLIGTVDGDPLSPEDAVVRAEFLLAEEGDAGQTRAIELVNGAIDASPAYREAHELLAQVLSGPEGDDALRRALALHPWSVELRDDLGLRLWDAGKRAEGAAELEESMRRYPWFLAHTYLTYPEEPAGEETTPEEAIRTLTETDELNIALANLDDEMAAAIERGLRRALNERLGGPERSEIVDQIATLLELRERWSDAADLLQAAAARTTDRTELLARAADDYLAAGNDAAAEKALLAALLNGPEQGALYQQLAVEVYAARGEFDRASAVLDAAQRNAIDLMPVYEGITDVLAQRKAAERTQPLAEPGWTTVAAESTGP